MSVETFNHGKVVRIVIPSVIAEDSTVNLEECDKEERDEECNWCLVKYACKLFRDSMPIIECA